MKAAEIQPGQVYAAKVNKRIVPVRIDSIDRTPTRRTSYWTTPARTSYSGTNLRTGRQITIKSAAKLRYLIPPTPAPLPVPAPALCACGKPATRTVTDVDDSGFVSLKVCEDCANDGNYPTPQPQPTE